MPNRITISICAVLALVLAACGGGSDTETSVSNGDEEVSPESTVVDPVFAEPIPILRPQNGDVDELVEDEYVLTDSSTTDWEICVSFPTMQDPYWLAANYGVVSQAERLGVSGQILDAGGYENLSKQISDLEDCVAGGADAVLVAAISGEGVNAQVEQIVEGGVPVIETVNRIGSPEVTARSTLDFHPMGLNTANHLLELVGDEEINVAFLPGPEGAGWTNRALEGFEEGIANSNVTLVDIKWGDTGKEVQFQLVEDVLQAHESLDYIIGNAVAAEAAVSAIEEAGRADEVQIASFYQTQEVYAAIANDDIAFASNDNVAWMAAMAVDLAVRILEGEDLEGEEVWPTPGILTFDDLPGRNETAGFAPEGWTPQFDF